MKKEDKIELKDWAYKKYKGKCAYCRNPITKEEATLDHIVPKLLGGRNGKGNIALACEECNKKKGHMTPQQWRMEMACNV